MSFMTLGMCQPYITFAKPRAAGCRAGIFLMSNFPFIWSDGPSDEEDKAVEDVGITMQIDQHLFTVTHSHCSQTKPN